MNRKRHPLMVSAALAILCGLPLFAKAESFSIEHADAIACANMRQTKVLTANAPVRCDQLATVRFRHVDFQGATHEGSIVVMAAAAPHVRALFDELYRRRFPIAKARPMQAYQGDDAASMRDNNTSAFNDRAVTGGGAPSLHAYGLAIDLNPVQNPYLRIEPDGRAVFDPAAGHAYANRREPRPGKPARQGMAEPVVALFAWHGFSVWGGDWDMPIDYQHFQVPRALAEELAALPPKAAAARFDAQVAAVRRCLRAQETPASRATPQPQACR